MALKAAFEWECGKMGKRTHESSRAETTFNVFHSLIKDVTNSSHLLASSALGKRKR